MSEKKSRKPRKKLTKRQKIKLTVWLVVIVVIVLGFVHQYYIHTDGYIKKFFENNKSVMTEAADALLEKPTFSDEFIESVADNENRITADQKINIGFLIDNPYYADESDVLSKVKKAGIQDVKSTYTTVRFYASARFVLIYSPDADDVAGAKTIGDGWFFIDTF